MLFQRALEYEQSLSMVMRVLEHAEVKKEDKKYILPLGPLFQTMEQDRPDSVAVWQYKIFKTAAGKTSRSVLVSTAA